MKKRTLIFLIILCLPITLFIIGRLTGILTIYTIKTSSSYPNLQPNDAILTSTISKAKNEDFISFQQNIRPEYGNSHWIYRMVANENDFLEIKNGECFINGKSIDEDLDLTFPFLTSSENQLFFQKKYPANNADLIMSDSLTTVFLSKSECQNLPKEIKVERIIIKKGVKEDFQTPFFGDKNKEFNIDNYGPIKIPKDSCFVLGDNRHQADDSRFWGFVAKKNIKGIYVMKIDFLSWLYKKLDI